MRALTRTSKSTCTRAQTRACTRRRPKARPPQVCPRHAGDKYTNEDQAVELRNGSVLINARSLANPGGLGPGGTQQVPSSYSASLRAKTLFCSELCIRRTRPRAAFALALRAGPRKRDVARRLSTSKACLHKILTALLIQRIQARSDDGGETFAATMYALELPQPVNGCEGSIVKHPNGTLFVSGPNSRLLRASRGPFSEAPRSVARTTLRAE